MTARSSPISFTDAMVRAIRAGEKTETRRPTGRHANARPGDRLWIREPFHLSLKHDLIAPLQAVARGHAIVAFAADLTSALVAALDLGKRRAARTLPRVWHRAHLVVASVRTERLQSIVDAGARAEGVGNVAEYRELWDTIHAGGRTMKGELVRWADDPLVDVVSFAFVDAALEPKS